MPGRLDDVVQIAYVPEKETAFEIVYREREKPVEVIYEAETPWACAELCAKNAWTQPSGVPLRTLHSLLE